MSDSIPPDDPVERLIFDGLIAGGYDFTHEGDPGHPFEGLDFWLSVPDIHIECKRFYSPRSIEQLHRFSNVILVQGIPAAEALSAILAGMRINRS